MEKSVLPIHGLVNHNGNSNKDRWDEFYQNKKGINLVECSTCNRKHSKAVDCITYNRDHGFQCAIALSGVTEDATLAREYTSAFVILKELNMPAQDIQHICYYILPE